MKMSRLLYTSKCSLGGSDAERLAHVRTLAQDASRRNAQLGITGALLFVENSFVQVLEGPERRVEAMFEKICCDFRHRDVLVADLYPIGERLFTNWSMAFLAESDAALRTGVEIGDVRFLAGVNAREALRQMRDLIDRSGPTAEQAQALAA